MRLPGGEQVDHAVAASSPTPAVSRFSTGEWPEPQRRDKLREIYGHTIMQLDVEPSREAPLNIDASFRTYPGLGLAYVNTSPTRVERTRQHLVNDDLFLNVSLSGGRTLRQRGREAVIGEGEAVLTTGAESSSTDISASQFITLRLPRKPIAALVTDLDDCMARRIRQTSAVRLLVDYTGVLQGEQVETQPELRRLAVAHIYDLAALAIGTTRDADSIATLRGASAARLRAVRTDINDHLGSPALSIAEVAARQRLPVRYLQRLFETDGTTFTDFVLRERLSRIHRMLTDARFAGRPISAIAFDCGFNHLSHFNRAFRARFGVSPSDIRTQAQRTG
jgi:AraC-like DNA-binding protein